MIRPVLACALALVCAGTREAAAQRVDELALTRRAMQSVWSALPERPIVLDGQAFRASADVIDALAREHGARRGSVQRIVHCAALPSTAPCSMTENVVVLVVSRPRVSSDTAEVAAEWWYQERPGTIARHDRLIRLVRSTAGAWRVVDTVIGRT